jgi:hypothetical protein
MRVLLLSSVSLLAGSFAGLAFAQTPVITDYTPPVARASSAATPQVASRPIAIGQTINGTIGSEDPKLSSDDSSYEIYRVQVPAGRRVTATLSSTAFQPVLGLGTRIDETCEGCTINVGETTKPAVVSRTMTSAGTLELRVNTMNAGESGAFRLSVTAAVPTALSAQPILFGQSKTGALTPNDATAGNRDTLTDAYALRLAANQNVQIDLSSSEFDAKLELLSPSGSNVAEDDDNGPGNSARIRFTAPRAGVYQIRATSVSESGAGAYTLRAGARPPVVPFPTPRPLVVGTPMSGAITATTPTYENDGEDTVAVRYSFNAVAGNIYRITADKKPGSELDPRVSVGRIVSGSYESVVNDDDGGEDTNASLRFRATTTGQHIVEVTPVGESLGAYDVKVSQSPPDRAPAASIPLTLGTEIKGVLSDGGARTSEDILFNSYSLTLTAGQSVTVNLKKDGESTLDPKLELGRGTPSAFEKSVEDDDGGSELNARLRFVAPADGTYLIRATSINATSEGGYVLRVDPTPPPVIPPSPTAIQSGQALTGELTASDPRLNDKSHYDRFVLDGKVGDTFDISVSAEAFDVIVGARSSLREDDDYQTDDDSGGGTNAKLTYTISTAGPQTIRVTSLGEDATGSYTISIVKK